MPGTVLYSTNPYFAIDVCRRYRADRFYAWCSEVFSADQEAGIAPSHLVAPSSDPRTIYEQLARACDGEDRNDDRIKKYKRTFRSLANSWFDRGEISKAARDEILSGCKLPTWRMWRPFLYVIPRKEFEGTPRLQLVPANKRAGPGNEFIIGDLAPDEFDIIELPRLKSR